MNYIHSDRVEKMRAWTFFLLLACPFALNVSILTLEEQSRMGKCLEGSGIADLDGFYLKEINNSTGEYYSLLYRYDNTWALGTLDAGVISGWDAVYIFTSNPSILNRTERIVTNVYEGDYFAEIPENDLSGDISEAANVGPWDQRSGGSENTEFAEFTAETCPTMNPTPTPTKYPTRVPTKSPTLSEDQRARIVWELRGFEDQLVTKLESNGDPNSKFYNGQIDGFYMYLGNDTDLPYIRPQGDTYIFYATFDIPTRWVIGPILATENDTNPTIAGNYLFCVEDFEDPIEDCSWRLMNSDGSNYSPKIEITSGITYSLEPTVYPSKQPSARPTSLPTRLPTRVPSKPPTTLFPTVPPTSSPTSYCATLPSNDLCTGDDCGIWTDPITGDTLCRTIQPTLSPTTPIPTETPSLYPTSVPSRKPTTGHPTLGPTNPPSPSPTTLAPSRTPTSAPTSFCSTLTTREECDKYTSCLWENNYCEQTLPPTATPTVQSVLDKIESWINQLNQGIFAGMMLGCGPILCLFGQKLFKFIIFIIGFCLIGWSTLEIFKKYDTGFLGIEDDEVLYVSIGMAILGGGVLLVLTKLSILLCGALFGMIAAQGIWQLLETALISPLGDNLEWVHLVVVGGFGLVGALLAYKLVNLTLKAITAFIGAFFTVSGGAYFYAEASDEEVWLSPESFWKEKDLMGGCGLFCVGCYVLWFIIFFAGAWYQYRGKNLCKDDKPSKEEMQNIEMRRVIQGRPQQVIINGRPANLRITLKKKGRSASREVHQPDDLL